MLRATHRDEDPDAVISRQAALLAPAARTPLARHIGDLRTIDLPDVAQAPLPPVELLAAFGADGATREAVTSARSGVAVALMRPRAEALTAERAVRAAAVLLSGPSDVTIDTAIPRVWPVVDRTTDVPRTADWFVLDRTSSGARRSTRTQGLSRFALPELVVDDVDDADLPAWEAAMVGVAHVLLDRLSAAEHDVLVLEPVLRITVADIAQGYAEPFDPADPTVRRGTDLGMERVQPSMPGTDAEAAAGSEETALLVLTGSPVTDLFG